MTHFITSIFMTALFASQTFLLYVSIKQADFFGTFLSLVAMMIALLVIYSEYKIWRREKRETDSSK